MLKVPVKFAAVLLFLLLQLARAEAFAESNSNELAVGRNARVKSKLNIQINPPAEFNYKSRSEILAMRSREVSKYPALLKGNYIPYNAVFGAIEDSKPWWGLAGAAVFDSGKRSMLGLAEESRFLMNPFLLVAANPGSTGIWNSSMFTAKQINDPAFPYFWLPDSLELDPVKQVGKVTYHISEYQKKIFETGLLRGPVQVKRFSLVAYNARDMGYNYIYFNPQKSINVINDNPTDEAAYIKQFIHCGGTCGNPASCCNNMSPFMGEIDRLRINRVPARAVVYLWKEQPQDVQKNPDMVFLLEFH